MYRSPIEIIYGQTQTQIEGDIFRAIQSYGINVDKEELIRALREDRQQYEKGYLDGRTDAMAELVRCKDCKHRGSNLCPMETVEIYPWFGTKNDAFCSYGERREGE